MKKLILKNKFDIIHSHLIYADFWSASLRTFFGLKTTLVSTLHGYQEDIYTKYCTEPKKTPHNNYFRVAKFAYKRIDHVYSCSDGLKNFFLAAGIKFKNNVSVIYHGFDYKNLSDTLREDKDFICSIPGRLIPRKGHYFVLNQCKKLIEAIPHFKLQIIGDGPLRKELEEFVAQNNLSHVVKFTGNVPSVLPLLQNSDLVLIPSYAEGLPLVIFEAMSVSKPVIAFNTIGPAEAVLDGKTGYLIEPFDSDLFAEKIIFLSKNTSLLIDMGLAGKKYLESTFTLEIMVANTISFYQTCLNDRPLLTT